MSKATYRAALIACLVLLAACGSSGGDPGRTPSRTTRSTRPAATRTWPCLASLGAHETRTSDGLPVADIGTGHRVVVLSNESDQDACGWRSAVPSLIRAGLRVLAYDYQTDPVHDLTSVARYARTHGADRVALLGASEGAKVSIIAATALHPAAAAVVSLSAESTLQATDVAPYARRLRTATLYVTAAADPYGSTTATRGFYRAAPAATKRLIVVPGSAHGTALLTSASLRATVAGFLTRGTG